VGKFPVRKWQKDWLSRWQGTTERSEQKPFFDRREAAVEL
jgi:hypothetical protein